MIRLRVNNTTNLRHLSQRVIPTKWRSYHDHRLCDVTSLYAVHNVQNLFWMYLSSRTILERRKASAKCGMRVDLWKKMHRTECRTPLFWSFLDCLVLTALLLFRFRLYMPSFAVYTNGMLTNVLSFAFTSIFNHTATGHPKYTIRDAILTCARKPTWVSLIYRTEPTTKKCKNRKKTKGRKQICSEIAVNSPGNPCIVLIKVMIKVTTLVREAESSEFRRRTAE